MIRLCKASEGRLKDGTLRSRCFRLTSIITRLSAIPSALRRYKLMQRPERFSYDLLDHGAVSLVRVFLGESLSFHAHLVPGKSGGPFLFIGIVDTKVGLACKTTRKNEMMILEPSLVVQRYSAYVSF